MFLAFEAGTRPLGDRPEYPSDRIASFDITTEVDGGGSINVPLSPALVGLTNVPIYVQRAIVDPAGGFFGAVAQSDAVEVIVGPLK